MNTNERNLLDSETQRLNLVAGQLIDAKEVMQHLLNLTSLTDPSRDLSKKGVPMLEGCKKTIEDVIVNLEKLGRGSN